MYNNIRSIVYLASGLVALGGAIATLFGANIEPHLVTTTAFIAFALVCFEISLRFSKE